MIVERRSGGIDTQMPHTGATGVLVFGLGSWAFGKEQRAVTSFRHMTRLQPHFLISRWEDGSVRRLLERHGFEFEYAPFGYLGRSRLDWTMISLMHAPRLWRAVVRAYDEHRCTSVVAIDLRAFANAMPAVAWLRWRRGARVVLYVGDIPRDDGPNRSLGRAAGRLIDALVANSRVVADGWAAIGVDRRKIEVVYNGVNLVRFSTVPPLELRRQYHWPPDTLLVGFAGQLSARKGVWDFIHAAERALDAVPSCRFVLFGRSVPGRDERPAIERHLAERRLEGKIVLHGWVDQIERAYRDIDVLVVPSRYDDPAPNVVLEAMASGVPVVATRVGGTPELASDGETGFLVEREALDDIAARIVCLARDPRLRSRFGLAARERVQRLFDTRTNARRLEEIVRS